MVIYNYYEVMKMMMLISYQELVDKYGTKNIMIAAGCVVGVIILFLVMRSMRLKSLRKEVTQLESRLSAIKSLPIQYRLGRVSNIAKNTPELMDQFKEFEKRYDDLISMQKDEIAILLNEVDEKLYSGKLGGVRKKTYLLKETTDKFEKEANALLKEVESVTEIENIQRITIIKVKEKFRNMQETYTTSQFKLETVSEAIEAEIATLDDDFVVLENMMNQQLFEEAKRKCEAIDQKIDYLSANIRDLPTYLSLANTYIPDGLDEIKNNIVDLKARGFSLVRINGEARLAEMQETLNATMNDIQALKIENVGETLNELTTKVNALKEELEQEEGAQSEFLSIYQDIFAKTNELSKQFDSAKEDLAKLRKQYVINEDDFDVERRSDMLVDTLADMERLKSEIDSNQFSYQEVVERIKDLSEANSEFENYLKQFNTKRDEMYMVEKRALDELENINIVLLEIKSQIKNKNLPMINNSYKDYISESYRKASEIQFLCKSRPIMLDNLSEQVDLARDIIYKLYDNIHNLIVTADMVEEAIVFGNRYRSSYLEVNTELTKAEVLYRNGEYTRALTTAVDIIERIKPGSYEMLIKKSNKNQTNI